MRNGTMGSTVLLEGSEWIDPLEQQVRGGVRKFLHELIEQEVTEALGISRQHLYDILRERKPVSAEVAVRLGAALRGRPRRLAAHAGRLRCMARLTHGRRQQGASPCGIAAHETVGSWCLHGEHDHFPADAAQAVRR